MTTFLGIPFQTLVYSDVATVIFQQGHPLQGIQSQLRLPLRTLDHVYTPSDFLAYEESRDIPLRSDRRIGRAALLSGGIIWRLAIETVAPDIVLEGPGELAYAHGLGFTFYDQSGAGHVDDTLAEEEKRLIIGTYVREPRERKNLHGRGLPSYWPHPEHFNVSSLNFGWWSPMAERWYCKLRSDYRGGDAQPRLGSHWLQSIRKWDKRALKITETGREAAFRFLRSRR